MGRSPYEPKRTPIPIYGRPSGRDYRHLKQAREEAKKMTEGERLGTIAGIGGASIVIGFIAMPVGLHTSTHLVTFFGSLFCTLGVLSGTVLFLHVTGLKKILKDD